MEARTVTPDARQRSTARRAGRRRRWTVALGTVRLITVSALIIGGGLLVTAGALLEPHYVSSVLLEIGAALFLAVPLILLERLLSDRIENVETSVGHQIEGVATDVQTVAEDVHRAHTKIEELGRETSSRIAAARESDTELLSRLRTDPSEVNVMAALRRAQEFSALDQTGVRVRLPKHALRMRFNPDVAPAGRVEISVEERNGTPVTGYESWSEGESAEEALVALAADLQRQAAWPGDESFDAADIFERLAATLETVIRVSTNGRAGGPLRRLIELDDRWALTQYGLEHVDDASRGVRTRLLLDDPEAARARLLAGAGAQDQTIDHVLETAVQYHMGVAQRTADQRMPRTR